MRQQPGDLGARIALAWLGMPSDETWNQLKGLTGVYPDNPWLHAGMGRVYVAWKMKDQAKASFQLALARRPAFPPATVGLGDVARLAGDLSGAEAHYRAALGGGFDAPANAGLGHTLLAAGRRSEALEAFKRSVAEWPEQPEALGALLALSVEAKDPGTRDVAAALVALQPKNRDARRFLADLRFEAGEKKEAAEDYERLFALGAVDVALAKRAAELYRELGDPTGEERCLVRLAGLDGAGAEASLRLAELLDARGDGAGAEKRLVEAAERAPALAEPHLRLGLRRKAAGLLHEAARAFREGARREGPAAEQAKAEWATLEKELELPKKTFSGGVDAIYVKTSTTLGKLFEKQRAKAPKLAGLIRLRVRVTADGVVEGVDVLEDTVKSPVLLAHAYFALADAVYPKQRREPVFEFELGRPARK